MIWRIVQIEEAVIYRGRMPSWITASEINTCFSIQSKYCYVLNTYLRRRLSSKFPSSDIFCLVLRLFCSGLVSCVATSSSDNHFFFISLMLKQLGCRAAAYK